MSDSDDLAERVDALEQRLERQHEAHEQYKQQFVKPRLAALADDRDDLTEQVGELQDAVATLRDRVRDLEVGIDSVIGLAEDEQGGPAKRCADLRLGLIRSAEATSDATTAAKHWKHVQTFFAEHGHGEVKKPECYQAMADVAEYDGFYTEEKALTLPSGHQGRGVFVDTELLPEHASVGDSSAATTHSGGDPATSASQD